MAYLPHNENEIAEMLSAIGVKSVEGLYASIPSELRAKSFAIPEGLSEIEAESYFRRLADANRVDPVNFLGGGYYDHYIPAAVDALSSRGEFYTAYTPYQPEASQGTLQALYEYQTAVCNLTGMDVSNASLYDGGSAIAEAVLMAMRLTRRTKIVVDGGVHPLHLRIVRTYLQNLESRIVVLNGRDYGTDRLALTQAIDDETAAVVVQNPNFFGAADDYTDVAGLAKSKGALTVVSTYPVALGLLKTPGEMEADIAVAEGQSLGLPLSFGGPYLGMIACRESYVRQLPGRIVGATKDRDGKRAFVLTLQAREQHIRREKATSNICSNQGLCALRAGIYLSLLGSTGIRELAALIRDKAAYAKSRLAAISGVTVPDYPCFNEFVVRLPKPAKDVAALLLDKGFAAGIPLDGFYPERGNELLVAVTEKRTREEIDRLSGALEAALK